MYILTKWTRNNHSSWAIIRVVRFELRGVYCIRKFRNPNGPVGEWTYHLFVEIVGVTLWWWRSFVHEAMFDTEQIGGERRPCLYFTTNMITHIQYKSHIYSTTRINRISADCEIYPIYSKSDIHNIYKNNHRDPISPSSTVYLIQ